MSTTSKTPLATFDLSEESSALYAQQRGVRRGFSFLCVIFTGAVLWFIGISLSRGLTGPGWIILSVVAVGCLLVLGEFVVIIWKWQRGAVCMEIRDRGIEFTWHSGRSEFLPWSTVSRDIVLRDSSGSGWADPASNRNWEIRRWSRPVTRIPRVAFDAVIQAGSSRGLAVKEQTMASRPWRWFAYRQVRFAIRPAARP